MTHDDAVEAARLLLFAGVPKEQITYEALLIADALIQDVSHRLAERLVERFFPEWKRQSAATSNKSS